MNSAELRIGNLLQWRLDKKDATVTEIFTRNNTQMIGYASALHESGLNWISVLSDFEPIPLTEELILKLGFEVCHKTWVRHSFDYADSTEHGIEINLMERGGWENPQYRYYGRYIDVQYVHQVQNLFYALSGIELKFKS